MRIFFSCYRSSSAKVGRTWRRPISLIALALFGLLTNGAMAQENLTPSTGSPATATTQKVVRGYEIAFPALGTRVELKAFHHDQATVERGFAQVKQQVVELEAILTDYDPTSETRQLSNHARFDFVNVSDPLWEVLSASDRWHRLSDGAFDSSLGQLTHLWSKYRRTTRQPSPDELRSALAHTGWKHVDLDADQHRVRFDCDDLRLDFGGIGKGFIVDEAFALLEQHGLDCSLVNISGNLRAGVPPPERSGWRIEIAPLERGGQPLRQITIASTSIATSGDLWQFTVIDGVRRSHILDPRTGLGVAGPLCATAISPQAVDADALATTAVILGFEKAQDIAKQFEGTELLLARRIVSADSDEHIAENEKISTKQRAATLQVQHTASFPQSLGNRDK